jgi:LytR cell envelope-related transcriptional attenuator
MSNSTRPGGYDDSLVVPLEASRRGAHRARVSRLVAALPLLAVVVVVAAVIGVAYVLFLKQSNTADTSTQGLPTVPSPSAATAAPAPTPSGGSTPGSSPSTSASASATPDKTARFTVYNGSVNFVPGLAARARDALKAAGWSGGQVSTASPPTGRNQATKVYYARSSQRVTAEALAQAVKAASVTKNAAIAAQGIAVVVGDGYKA